MKQKLLYIFTRTPLHVGAGSSVGAIDQPIQRERHTGFPIIPGSSIKGVLRDHFRSVIAEPIILDNLFGQGGDGVEFSAGQISFGEAKLLLFPVRSAKGSFALATSPLALQRFARDAGIDISVPDTGGDMKCLASDKVILDRNGLRGVVLEEYRFDVAGSFPSEWETILTELIQDDAVLSGASGRFVLLSDGDLSHFAVNACPVSHHVRINDETGTADGGALFCEECVPSETLLYSPLVATRTGEDNPIFSHFEKTRIVQFGGSGTTGLGFCTLRLGGL